MKRLNVGQCAVGTMLMASVNRWNSRSNTFFVVSSHALARKCEDITARPWWWCGYNFPKFSSESVKVPAILFGRRRRRRTTLRVKMYVCTISLSFVYPCITADHLSPHVRCKRRRRKRTVLFVQCVCTPVCTLPYLPLLFQAVFGLRSSTKSMSLTPTKDPGTNLFDCC